MIDDTPRTELSTHRVEGQISTPATCDFRSNNAALSGARAARPRRRREGFPTPPFLGIQCTFQSAFMHHDSNNNKNQFMRKEEPH